MTNLPFGFHRPEDSPGFVLWQTTMIWQRQIRKALEPHDVTHPEFVLLASLLWFEAHQFERTQAALIDWTKLDKMTVSKALKKLEKLRYVTRLEHESDSRAKIVSLTLSGKVLTRTLVPIVEDIDAQFFGQASQQEIRVLVKTLLTILRVQSDFEVES